MTLAAEDWTPNLRLERNLIVLAAMITNNFESFLRIISRSGFFCPAFRTPLRRHQIPLIKDLLFLFCKKKSFLALYADSFNVGHCNNLLVPWVFRYAKNITHLKSVSSGG